ncbi:MAG: hypothetical protein WDN69_23345 [Aliidongia sp.]
MAAMVALAGCSLIGTEEPATPVAVASDQPFPPQLEQGLDLAAVAGDPVAIGALAGANPAFAERIVAFAVTAHPPKAASFAAAAAQAQPDMAPQLAAAAATANPTAAVEIAGRSAAAVPARSEAIGDAVLAVLLPDEQRAMETRIAEAVRAAAPPTVDDWALAGSAKH